MYNYLLGCHHFSQQLLQFLVPFSRSIRQRRSVGNFEGGAAGTASWATNVGNERGEVVASVLTASEDVASLKSLADGLVRRYTAAGEHPPLVLYTDRDCYADTGPSKMEALFDGWSDIHVRLDVWHFMRRLAQGMQGNFRKFITNYSVGSYVIYHIKGPKGMRFDKSP